MNYQIKEEKEKDKYKKNLSEKLKKIEKDVEKLDDNREYWVAYLNINIVKMFENIPMIKMEIDAINHMEKMKKENPNKLPENKDKEHKKIETLTNELNSIKNKEEYNPLYIITFKNKEHYKMVYSSKPHFYIMNICKKNERKIM